MLLSELRGRTILLSAKAVGRAVQGMLSDDLKTLDGIWSDGGILGMRLICADQICVMGKSAIHVSDRGEHQRMKPRPLRIRAVGTGGARLGAIVDAEVNETSLCVEALILSRGYLDDLTHGRDRVTRFETDRAHSRVLIPEGESRFG